MEEGNTQSFLKKWGTEKATIIGAPYSKLRRPNRAKRVGVKEDSQMGDYDYDGEDKSDTGMSNGTKFMIAIFGTLVVVGLVLAIVSAVGTFSLKREVNDLVGTQQEQQQQFGANNPSLPHVPDTDEWLAEGNNIRSTGANEYTSRVTRHNAEDLFLQGKLPHTGSGVSSTVTFKGGLGYYTAWDGTLTCFTTETLAINWRVDLSILNSAPTLSQSAPAIGVDQSGREVVVIVDLGVTSNATSATSMYSFDRHTGSFQWKSILSTSATHSATISPVIWQDRVFWGLSSNEQDNAGVANYTCCQEVGVFGATNLGTGALEWQKETISPTQQAAGWSGASVVGSTATIHNGAVFFTTGHSFSRPASVDVCLATQTPAECLPSDVWVDSIIKADAYTGAVIQVFQAQGVDTWNADCINDGLGINANGNCPYTSARSSYGFSGPAMIVPLQDGRTGVFAMQKSNVAWMLDAANLDVIWSSLPGGYVGGPLASKGYSYDDERHTILVPSPNFLRRTYLDKDGRGHCGSFVSALNAETGKLVWITPIPGAKKGVDCAVPLKRDPELDHINLSHGADLSLDQLPYNDIFSNPINTTLHGAHGPVRYATGVAYATTTAGTFISLDAHNGNILFTYECGSTIYGGASIDSDRVFFGCGTSGPGATELSFTANQGAMVVLTV